jgi:hypothetical protein
MQKHVLMLTASASILACGGIAVSAQQTPGGPMVQEPDHHPQTQQQPTDHEGRGMMGQGGMMGRGMMGQGGVMGRGMMGPIGPAMMMRMIFALWTVMVTGPSHCRNFRRLTNESSRPSMPTKMAASLRRRCRLSCREPRDRFRGSSFAPPAT